MKARLVLPIAFSEGRRNCVGTRVSLSAGRIHSAETPTLRQDHPFGAALRNLDVGREVERGVENAGRIAIRPAGNLAGPGKLRASGSEIGTRRNDSRRDRGVKGQHLVFVRLHPEQLFQFLELIRLLGGDVLILR